ncbi:MAG: V-type ATPase subunit [Gemmatimonadaceae bacterium]
MTDWSDVVARVSGLSGRLASEQVIHVLAESRSLAALSVALATANILATPLERATPRELELAVRRHAAGRLRLLARWAGARVRMLTPLYEDEDRRSLRAVLRGAACGALPDERMAGLIPTPALPERVLHELARQGDVATLVAQLATMGNPYAAALREASMRQHPDLLQLESAVNRTFAARATAAAAMADGAMRDYTQSVLDIENLWSALALWPRRERLDVDHVFLAGGRWLTADAFRDLIQAPTAADRETQLRRLSDAPILSAAVTQPARAEDAVLDALIDQAHATARVEPLGTAPVIRYVLELRRNVRSIDRIIWSLSMQVPVIAVQRALRPSAAAV